MPAPDDILHRDHLAASLRARTCAAAANGALVPLATSVRTLHAGDIEFIVRVAGSSGARKPAASENVATPGQPPADPFMPPYELDLYVGAVTSTHVGLLNKYPVMDDHLLLVTRAWEDQTAALTTADFAAMLTALGGIDGLAFYNGGREAGASQPHRHLQIVPLPLAGEGSGLGPRVRPLPVEPWWEGAGMTGEMGHNDRLPFEHVVSALPAAWLADPGAAAPAARARYLAMWRYLGRDPAGPWQPQPFNLLATRRWLWLVPRRREGVAGLSVNALGFAGALLAGDEDRSRRLQAMGPLALLASV